jgi:ABC-type oligopeptide transport system substrate-binding subunit
VLYTCSFAACLEQGRIARRNLAAAGIDLEVETVSLFEMFRRLTNPGEPWDIGYLNWYPASADPSDFVAGLFDKPGEDARVGGFHDKALERRLRAALRVADTTERGRAFARLDADFARAGAAVPFATDVSTDFFSDRIGCQIDQPIYGISLGALCVRR